MTLQGEKNFVNTLNPFEINITAAVTGHRILKRNFDYIKLLNIFSELIGKGYKNFLCGMALGFDAACFKTLEQLRNENSIKIIACLPCSDQDKFFNEIQKNEYRRMIDSADEVILLNKEYFEGCMLKRNDFLIDNSSLLLAYKYCEAGGAAYTVKNALKKGKIVLYY